MVLLHCESNTGYAIGPLEATFFEMAMRLCEGDRSRIHFAYPSMIHGPTSTLPRDFSQYVIVNSQNHRPEDDSRVESYIKRNQIDTIFGFDQPVSRPIYSCFRRSGIKNFISYWGAPMSSVFGGAKLLLKRLDVALRRNGPDHYIFESAGMARTAIFGRGIPRQKTSVVFQGVDVDRFRPDAADRYYVYDELKIDRSRKVFFYSGHMEERKGVAVIMKAANCLSDERVAGDWQIVLFGNRDGEETPHLRLLSSRSREHVVFGGYRDDLHRVQRGCFAFVIASTGWDSLPRSPLEAQASGLPAIVSNLPGLSESIDPESTGFLFAPGDYKGLAFLFSQLLDNTSLRDRLAANARRHAVAKFSVGTQLHRLTEIVATVVNRR